MVLQYKYAFAKDVEEEEEGNSSSHLACETGTFLKTTIYVGPVLHVVAAVDDGEEGGNEGRRGRKIAEDSWKGGKETMQAKR